MPLGANVQSIRRNWGRSSPRRFLQDRGEPISDDLLFICLKGQDRDEDTLVPGMRDAADADGGCAIRQFASHLLPGDLDARLIPADLEVRDVIGDGWRDTFELDRRDVRQRLLDEADFA